MGERCLQESMGVRNDAGGECSILALNAYWAKAGKVYYSKVHLKSPFLRLGLQIRQVELLQASTLRIGAKGLPSSRLDNTTCPY